MKVDGVWGLGLEGLVREYNRYLYIYMWIQFSYSLLRTVKFKTWLGLKACDLELEA